MSVAQLEFAPGFTDDIDRIVAHLEEYEVDNLAQRIGDIVLALSVLERNPQIGRPAGAHDRELVIGRGPRGYVALYRYAEELDTVFVLAVRSQREAGYADR